MNQHKPTRRIAAMVLFILMLLGTPVSVAAETPHLNGSSRQVYATEKSGPYITKITCSNYEFYYNCNYDIQIYVHFSDYYDIKTSNGIPYINLKIGDEIKQARYHQRYSTQNFAYFGYTVENGLEALDGVDFNEYKIFLNGATLQDRNGKDLPGITGGSLPFSESLDDEKPISGAIVDTIPPEVSGVEDGKKYISTSVTPTFTGGTAVYFKMVNGSYTSLGDFTSGTTISASGKYRVRVTDEINDVYFDFQIILSPPPVGKPTQVLSTGNETGVYFDSAAQADYDCTYIARAIPADGGDAIESRGDSSPVLFTGLPGGTYTFTVTATNAAGSSTSPASDSATVKKEQAELSITAITDKKYGDDPFPLAAAGGSGEGAVTFESDDPAIVSISGTTATIHKAGDVTIAATKAEDSTYNAATAAVSLTVGKKALIVKADDKLNITKGSAMPELTHKVTGLVDGDTFTNLDLSTTAANTDTVGHYDILISGGTLSNADSYAVTYEKGKLTVVNGGGGGGAGSSSAATPPAAEPTVSGSTAATGVEAKTGANGTAKAAVTDAQVKKAAEAAKKAAAQSDGAPKVEIKVEGAGKADKTEIILPKSAVSSLAGSGINALTISGPAVTVEFDADALKTIESAASGEVTVAVATADKNSLPESVRNAVAGRPVYDFTVSSGGNTISEFGGLVTVSIPYTPAAGEDTNAIVICWINDAGGLEIVPNARYHAATGTVVFTTGHFSKYAVGYNKVSFADVADSAWYAGAVTYLAAREVTSGTTAAAFSPDASLTRGQFLTLLLRTYGIAAEENASDNFSDAGDTYYTGYLAAAKRLGISNGVGGNQFAPEEAITRQEMFTMLYNALKVIGVLPENNSGKSYRDFTDNGAIAAYAEEAIAYLVENGVIGGSNGLLAPAATTTRAQMAQVLYHLMNG